jgi:nicotinamide riboside transporter PnuC
MGWIANFFLILGHFLIGKKNILCFPCFIVGNSIWLYLAITQNPPMTDMSFLSAFFIGMAIWNYFIWSKNEK